MDSKKSKAEDTPEQVNPALCAGDYLIEIKSGGRVLKQVAALNATVNILSLKDVPAAFNIN